MLYRGTTRTKKLLHGTSRAKFLVKGHKQLFPARRPYLLQSLEIRFTDDTYGRWLELGFSSDHLLTGSAQTGWTDPRGPIQLRLEWSLDLVTWESATEKFGDCYGSPSYNEENGTYDYWSRCAVPVKSTVRYADLNISVSHPQANPITGIIISGQPVTLEHFPYDMTNDAALLQSDLIAYGYTDAQVYYVDGTWTISMSNVYCENPSSDFSVTWPTFYNGSNPVSGDVYLSGQPFEVSYHTIYGQLVDPPRQFARLALSRLAP